MQPNTPEPSRPEAIASEPSRIRRGLIHGSLAAPMVLTVSSASATAMTSFGRCLANLNDRAPGPFFVNDATADNWLRKSVRVAQVKYQGTLDWYYLDPTWNEYVRLSAPTVRTGLSPLTPGLKEEAYSTRWALVWVDSRSGSMYSVMQVQQPLGYQASTKSCYTSLLNHA